MPRFEVSRSIEIEATPEVVFDCVADFGRWTEWSPWLSAEPGAKVEVSSPANEVGSTYSWNGELVGSGEMEHRQLQPGVRIDNELRIIKPWKSTSQVAFDLAPASNGTTLTWSMKGSVPFFLFFIKNTVRTMIGMDYDRGLKMLKEYIETGKVSSQTTINGVQDIQPLAMAGIRKQCALKDIGPSMEEALQQARQEFHSLGLPDDGQVLSIYHHFDMKNVSFDYTAGFVLPKSAAEGLDERLAGSPLAYHEVPLGKGLYVEHVGKYDHLGNAWSAANQYVRYKKMKQQTKLGCYELYLNEPSDTEPEQLRTQVILPLR